MAIRVIQLGSPRSADEGVRIGTVRRPPRGVPKGEIARRDFYDVWLPHLAPSAELVQEGKAVDDPKAWRAFVRRYRAEMARPDASHLLELLAALSQRTSFAVGCYCADEAHCHRSVLRELLAERGAALA